MPRNCRQTTFCSFTLIELITVVVVTAILLTPLVGALHGALAMRDRQETGALTDVRRQRALRILEQDFRNIVATGTLLSGDMIGEQVEDNGLRQDTLEFATATNAPHAGVFGADILRVGYAPTATDDGLSIDLIRSVYRNPLALEEEDPEEQILFTDVQSVTFSYFDGDDWVDSWDTTLLGDTLPEAIALRIELPLNDDQTEVINLTVPIVVKISDSGGEEDGS